MLPASSLERLEHRIAPAFVAVFDPVAGATFTGDASADVFVFSSDGVSFTHNRFGLGDPGFAGSADFDTTQPGVQAVSFSTTLPIVIDLGAGNDQLLVNATMPTLRAFGGTGDDSLSGGPGVQFLFGGPGNDQIDGNAGNDVLIGGEGDDTFVWDPGDGSDNIDGDAGNDTFMFNGSAGAEIFQFLAENGRLRVTRNIGTIVMDVGTVENVVLNAQGGTDSITVNALSDTSVTDVLVDLGNFGSPDSAADLVTVNGTALDDDIRLRSTAVLIDVIGLRPAIHIEGFEATDGLTVSGGAGIDNVVATDQVKTQMVVTLDGETESTTPAAFALGAAASIDVGAAPAAMAAGHLFGTGADLVVANSKSNSVSVLFNRGNGTFEAPLQLSTGGAAPKSVALADFNGDQLLDIAVTNSGSKNVAVLFNQGGGTFSEPALFPAGTKPGLLRVADVNGDGAADLITIVAGNRLSILPGDGTGEFGVPTTLSTGGKLPVDFLFTDLNGDGLGDLAVANAASNTVTVLPRATDLTFGAPVVARVGIKPVSLAVGDVDGDGRADLVVGHSVSRFVSVLLGAASVGGIPAFLPQLKLANPGRNVPSAVAVGDLNQDGRAEIVVANAASGTLTVFVNAGPATFRAPLPIDLDNTPPRKISALILADLNGDGRLDIATANAGTNDLSLVVTLRG